jgi:hypothetical protein
LVAVVAEVADVAFVALATVPVTFAPVMLVKLAPETAPKEPDHVPEVTVPVVAKFGMDVIELCVAPVTDAAVPVVFWFSVGTSAAWIVDITTFVPLPRKYEPLVTAPANVFIAPCAVVEAEPPAATGKVPAVSADAPVEYKALFAPVKVVRPVPP